MTTSLAERLAPVIAKYAESNGPHYDRMKAFVERIDQLSRRLKPGDAAPDFVMPAHDGSIIHLSDLLRDRPLVLFFIRGMWCPYCYEQVHAVKDAAAEFDAAGMNVAVITPEVGGRAAALAAELDLPFPVLCDVDSGVALAYGCLFPVPETERAFLQSRGIDLAQHYGSGAWFVPLPSVFGIGTDGTIASVFGGSEITTRPEPSDILSTARQTFSGSKD